MATRTGQASLSNIIDNILDMTEEDMTEEDMTMTEDMTEEGVKQTYDAAYQHYFQHSLQGFKSGQNDLPPGSVRSGALVWPYTFFLIISGLVFALKGKTTALQGMMITFAVVIVLLDLMDMLPVRVCEDCGEDIEEIRFPFQFGPFQFGPFTIEFPFKVPFPWSIPTFWLKAEEDFLNTDRHILVEAEEDCINTDRHILVEAEEEFPLLS
ncbi:unnamed protein product [Cyprideis torosa]|uniref:Uncharacterized protein n=1 Tax=Cyprideis torosa TaxID=163714 RepID=A0A7R8WFK5_9CRUS|nr:unnamed protein product [Cyprideis torosa]CAG0891029.1 unnamed protein product [Cyprideis torosa]